MCRIVMSSEVGVHRRNILGKKEEKTLLTKKKVRFKIKKNRFKPRKLERKHDLILEKN